MVHAGVEEGVDEDDVDVDPTYVRPVVAPARGGHRAAPGHQVRPLRDVSLRRAFQRQRRRK